MISGQYRNLNLNSFGSEWYYQHAILMAKDHPFYWRKIARFLSRFRAKWHNAVWRLGSRISQEENQKRAIEYARQCFKDTKLPKELKEALRNGMIAEFGFDPNPPMD